MAQLTLEILPPVPDGNKYRNPQPDLGTLSPKKEKFQSNPSPSGLWEHYKRGSRKSVKARIEWKKPRNQGLLDTTGLVHIWTQRLQHLHRACMGLHHIRSWSWKWINIPFLTQKLSPTDCQLEMSKFPPKQSHLTNKPLLRIGLTASNRHKMNSIIVMSGKVFLVCFFFLPYWSFAHNYGFQIGTFIRILSI